MIVYSDVQKSHLSGKQKQSPISYIKLNTMLAGISSSTQEEDPKLPEGRLSCKTEMKLHG